MDRVSLLLFLRVLGFKNVSEDTPDNSGWVLDTLLYVGLKSVQWYFELYRKSLYIKERDKIYKSLRELGVLTNGFIVSPSKNCSRRKLDEFLYEKGYRPIGDGYFIFPVLGEKGSENYDLYICRLPTIIDYSSEDLSINEMKNEFLSRISAFYDLSQLEEKLGNPGVYVF